MMRAKLHLAAYLVLDLFLLIAALSNLPAVFERAKAPFAVEKSGDRLAVSHVYNAEACPALKQGDRILSWNQYEVTSMDGMEFLSDLSSIGEKVTFRLERGESIITAEAILVPFYESLRFVIVMIIVGFVIWGTAIFVAFNRLDGPAAYSLHWALMSLAAAVLFTQGKISSTDVFSIISRLGLLISYLLAAALFFLFTTVYPRNKLGSMGLKASVIFLPALASTAATIYFFIEAIKSHYVIESYLQMYGVYHFVLAIFVIAIIASVVDSYVHARSTEDRLRLQWILWGGVVGLSPFLLFIIVPQILFSRDWIPEEFAAVFLLATPFSFAVSFVKYRLLDVEVMINRSIVYALLTLFIGLIYALMVILGISVIGGEIIFTEYLVVLLVTLLIAWLLNPLRHRLQRIIDETLFPARVNFRRIVTHLTTTLRTALSADELANAVVQGCIRAVPVSSIAFYTLEDDTLKCRCSHGLIRKIQTDVSSVPLKRIDSGNLFVVSTAPHTPEGEIDFMHADWLQKIGFVQCIPLLSETKSLHGIIAASPRSDSRRFTTEEIDLLKTIAAQASEVLERLLLQKKVILEQEERQKIEELNRLKSYFVATVSHELRTPLTSICMFAETLQHGNIRNEKQRREYVKIIDQETQRLSRLIDNVLDFSRVERGIKEYSMAPTDVRQVIKRAAATMKYQFEKQGVQLRVSASKAFPKINADGDALEEAVINLLSNAVKYSGRKKKVRLKALYGRNELVIRVTDRGRGIPKKDIPQIFNPYYRVKEANRIKGMGLGLSLVKHIVEAHNGTIEVRSELGKGSRFTIHLPLTQKGR
jgi:signal transduction histidine kinase